MNTSAEEKAAARVARRRWAPVRFVRARPWLTVSTLVFVAASSGMMISGVKPASALLLGFDLGALLFLSMLARMFTRASAEHLARQAYAQDTGRRGTLCVAVAVSGVVLVALSTELHAAKNGGAVVMGLAALSIVLSWLFMNTMYALHYAHGYYGDFGKQHEGLEFPGTKQPDYWDFVYFAFVVGMCFQVSDVQITSHTLRRTALLHSVVAFFFNVFIIALSVNIAAGLA
ncbi:DUF1345 domain-containing protein [Dyella caseinilytica]|uniref:DUF1345 domain-containing protein n=1 Tax=Dyella caseinilytica TaxID=1849581 RepID=A0ABX7GPZ5_9GAMM|nr:DUF1345 domain-containing protein [Dyella caseinilytica]QRN52478.1 DUF1345 domain-containing protein [Dyella caseinilytica]GGA06356.1 membrane protein [Dyella caseinilytica]